MSRAFLVCGSPGAGKSTYGTQLAKANQAALIDIDSCTEPLVRASLLSLGHNPDDRDSPYFKDTFREPIYQTLFDIAYQNLPWMNVVVVGPFTKELRDINWPERLKEKLRAEVEVHYISCNISERRRRLELRGNPRDVLKLKDWENHIRYFAQESPPVFAHIHVDTSRGSL